MAAGRPTGELASKTVLVTGGTGGIGVAIAARCLVEGARVVVTGRDRDRGAAALSRLAPLGDVWFVAADATDPADVERSVADTVKRTGRLDTLVANAGVALVARLIETPVEELDRLWSHNVRSVLLYVQAARRHLEATGGGVVTIGSDAGLRGEQAIGAYSVTKAAVVMTTKLLALDLAPAVRCNCVCPGATLPGMRHMGPPGDLEAGDDPGTWPLPPLGRVGRGEDVAEAVLFFAGPRSAWCSGAVLLVDGGLQSGVPG